MTAVPPTAGFAWMDESTRPTLQRLGLLGCTCQGMRSTYVPSSARTEPLAAWGGSTEPIRLRAYMLAHHTRWTGPSS